MEKLVSYIYISFKWSKRSKKGGFYIKKKSIPYKNKGYFFFLLKKRPKTTTSTNQRMSETDVESQNEAILLCNKSIEIALIF